MFGYRVDATDGNARVGLLRLPHGDVQTPSFMPVGTQGTVRALSPFDLENVGARIVLANTYHLHVRPGEDVVAALNGLHSFMAWPNPILTDSGGFQVFSLNGFRKVDDDGVEFQSHVDGGRRHLTPERAMDIQWLLGSDIAMAFDHVVAGDSERHLAAEALDRTALQGATFDDLRQRAVQQVSSLGEWSGIAVGGLAVGEPKETTLAVLDGLSEALPSGIPRYLMGVGFPEDLLAAISRGMDLFDCVAPTRNGRNGTAFTADGPLNISNSKYRRDPAPLEASCDCETCRTYSRGYLRHLFAAEELLGLRLLSLHNVRFLIALTEKARKQISLGTFGKWSRDWVNRYNARGTS
jgi:queuine tRNA-ribosyltransferase